MSSQPSRVPSWLAVSAEWPIWPSPAPTRTTTTFRKPVVSSGKWTRAYSWHWPRLSDVPALVAATLFLALVVHSSGAIGRVRAEAIDKTDTGQPKNSAGSERQARPSSMVDTKYWIRNMELNEPSNWLDNKKPCTLIEPIVISEREAIISMGGSQDSLGGALESNIRDFILAQDGILLLGRDTEGAQTDDAMFIQSLNESGDCFDSASLDFVQPPGVGGEGQIFKFEPYSDDMSWFNPANWRSELYADEEIAHLVPESNQIPCNEDMVVFGRSHLALEEVEPSSTGQATTFKVNFRSSEQYEGPANNPANMAGLRVSRLMIGEKSYSQSDFDDLIDLYGDTLFDFVDNKSVFNKSAMAGGDYSADSYRLDRQSILTIDESSTQIGAHELCQDEAGCQCANERPDLMRIICSFNDEPDTTQLPCHDPIQAPGYCKQICATSILISMDPTKFSERFIFSMIEDLNKLGPKASAGSVDSLSPPTSSSSSSPVDDYYSNNIFVGARRVDYNKYDITLHLMVKDDLEYINAIGREVEFAKLIKEQLEKAATKSFYGIKGIAIKSSLSWRQNNRTSSFIISFVMLVSLSTFFFLQCEKYPGISLLAGALSMANNHSGNGSDQQRPPDSSYITEPKILDEIASISDIPAVGELIKDDDRQADNIDFVELATHSTSGSTQNLIGSEDS